MTAFLRRIHPCGHRIYKLSLNVAELPKLDAEIEENDQGEEMTRKGMHSRAEDAGERGPKPIALIAADRVAHFDEARGSDGRPGRDR